MKAFIITMQDGTKSYECFVQRLPGHREDLFIVNFRDSALIRQLQASKALLHVDRTGRRRGGAKKGMGPAGDLKDQLLLFIESHIRKASGASIA